MKKSRKLKISVVLSGILLSATLSLAATDYSAMTNEELAAKRGTIMQQATVEEQKAFHNEWQKRIQQMSPAERQKALGPPENAPRDGAGWNYDQRPGLGSGPGAGSGMGGGRR